MVDINIMDSKYLNQMCFIEDERFHNRDDISPYIYIYGINKATKTMVTLNIVDNYGRILIKSMNYNWIEKNFSILDSDVFGKMKNNFIRILFERKI